MKKAVFKTESGPNGFIRSTLAPVNDKREARFGWWDIVLLLGLVFGGIAVARMFLAH